MAKDAEEVMLSSNKEGIDKVLREQGGYAFFMESTTIEYVTERYCQLQQVGGLLDSKSYGIAVQQGEYLFISRSIWFYLDLWRWDFLMFRKRFHVQNISVPIEMQAVQFTGGCRSCIGSLILRVEGSWLLTMRTSRAVAKKRSVVRFFQNSAKIIDAKFIFSVRLVIVDCSGVIGFVGSQCDCVNARTRPGRLVIPLGLIR